MVEGGSERLWGDPNKAVSSYYLLGGGGSESRSSECEESNGRRGRRGWRGREKQWQGEAGEREREGTVRRRQRLSGQIEGARVEGRRDPSAVGVDAGAGDEASQKSRGTDSNARSCSQDDSHPASRTPRGHSRKRAALDHTALSLQAAVLGHAAHMACEGDTGQGRAGHDEACCLAAQSLRPPRELRAGWLVAAEIESRQAAGQLCTSRAKLERDAKASNSER
ncbi:hypothetical protein DFH27DRAFT_651887 [Peziza echinospora]|nr:hypothetical protein DFH27DRAFT_651887 [Peziza echinospora]